MYHAKFPCFDRDYNLEFKKEDQLIRQLSIGKNIADDENLDSITDTCKSLWSAKRLDVTLNQPAFFCYFGTIAKSNKNKLEFNSWLSFGTKDNMPYYSYCISMFREQYNLDQIMYMALLFVSIYITFNLSCLTLQVICYVLCFL